MPTCICFSKFLFLSFKIVVDIAKCMDVEPDEIYTLPLKYDHYFMTE